MREIKKKKKEKEWVDKEREDKFLSFFSHISLHQALLKMKKVQMKWWNALYPVRMSKIYDLNKKTCQSITILSILYSISERCIHPATFFHLIYV